MPLTFLFDLCSLLCVFTPCCTAVKNFFGLPPRFSQKCFSFSLAAGLVLILLWICTALLNMLSFNINKIALRGVAPTSFFNSFPGCILMWGTLICGALILMCGALILR